MSKGLITPGGLKYTLSDLAYETMEARPELYGKLGSIIEAAEVFPSFAAFATYVVVALTGTVTSWIMIPIYGFIAYVIASIMSNWISIFFNPIVRAILTIYKTLSRFFLNYVGIILIAIFAIKVWYAALVYILGLLIVSFVMTMSIGGYQAREVFNDRVVKKLTR